MTAHVYNDNTTSVFVPKIKLQNISLYIWQDGSSAWQLVKDFSLWALDGLISTVACSQHWTSMDNGVWLA